MPSSGAKGGSGVGLGDGLAGGALGGAMLGEGEGDRVAVADGVALAAAAVGDGLGFCSAGVPPRNVPSARTAIAPETSSTPAAATCGRRDASHVAKDLANSLPLAVTDT